MARVPHVRRDELDSEGQEIYDRIRQDRNADEVGLQFRALLNSPVVAGFLTSMGAELRFRNALPDDVKELAVLLVAREWNSDIEWTAHAPTALRAGVSAESIEAVRAGRADAGLPDQVLVIARFVHQLLREKVVSDETFAAAHEAFGTRGVVDLTLTVSYYSALALAQIALKLEMEPGRASTL
ncbi:MAG: carboxymuconolactone decarboxylase family protein [Chloroflexi bacterium]|nr:carboxymuconolactone decarboxylase family protein [Chloroflexota bacterium]